MSLAKAEYKTRESKQGYQFMRNLLIYTDKADLDTIKRTADLLKASTKLLSVGQIAAMLLLEIPRPRGKRVSHEVIREHRKIFLAEMEKRCYAALCALKGI
jgi:hypothetical protein